MRLAITGASGFIGAAVVRKALASGHHVVVLQRPATDASRLRGVTGWTAVPSGTSETAERLKAECPDVLVHCAWRGVAGRDRNEPWQITENLPMTLASVGLAAEAGCRAWIGLGSQAEYGNPNRRVSESDAERPTTLYGRAKLSAGIAACGLARALGLEASWLRVFSTYGPDDSPHWFLPYLVGEFAAGRRPRLTGCDQRWDYLHVDDAAAAVLAAAAANVSGTFNLGSGAARPLREWVELVRRLMGSDSEPEYGAVPYRDDQVMHLEADISCLRAATGWAPCITPEAGIASILPSVPSSCIS